MNIYKQALLAIALLLSAAASLAQTVEGSWANGSEFTGGTNPLGNVTFVQSSGGGTNAGTYVALVNHADGSYTLHFITVDNASIVTSHTTSTDNGSGETVDGVEFTNGESLGDVLEGISTESSFGGADTGSCLGFYCNDSDPFGGSMQGFQSYTNDFGG